MRKDGDARAAKLSIRAVIERFDATSISGWAADANGAVGALQLLIDDRPVALLFRRFDRHDVADALGVPRGGLYGFEVMLPSWVWSLVPTMGESRMTVLANGQPIDRPITLSCASFDIWRQRIGESTPRAGVAPSMPPASAPGGIDQIDSLVVSGWLRSQLQDKESLEVICADQPISCAVTYVDRPDIGAALAAGGSGLGFELELPGQIWQRVDADGCLNLRVRVAGVDLEGSPWRIDSAILGVEIAKLRAADAMSTPRGWVLDPAERQYRSLLLVEHATVAPSIADLRDDAADWLRMEAARYGLVGVLAKRHAEGALADKRIELQNGDDTAKLHWKLLREINDQLGARSAHLAWQTFDDAFAKVETAEQRWQLLGSTMPTICTLGGSHRLRRYAEQSSLDELLKADDVWGLSLALAIVAARGDVPQATTILRRMQPLMDRGWLNTACVHSAAAAVVGQMSRGSIDPQVAEPFVEALAKIFESYHQDYWSRAYDHQLIACMVTLLRGSEWMADPMRTSIAQLAVAVFGLQPDFWRMVGEADGGAGRTLSAPLQLARRAFERIQARVESYGDPHWPDLHLLDNDLQTFRTLGCRASDIVQRQVLQALLQSDRAPDADAIRSVVALSERMGREEILRTAAFPGGHGDSIVLGVGDLIDRIRAFRLVPTNPHSGLQRTVCEDLVQLSTALRGPDFVPTEAMIEPLTAKIGSLTHSKASWVGLGLHTLLWGMLRDRGIACGAHFNAIRRAMFRASESCLPNEPPPAPITDALHQLALAELRNHDADILALIDGVRQRYLTAGPMVSEALSLASTITCPDTKNDHAFTDTIVIVYSCRKYLDTRIKAFRSTWSIDLVQCGIPYLVLVGDGDDRIEGDVLALDVSDRYEDLPSKSLKMVEWIFHNTNYQHLYKIDDDCFVDVKKLFGGGAHRAYHYYGRRLHRALGSTDRLWHQDKSSTLRAQSAIDKSPEPSTYADGGCGYNLSRFAMANIIISTTTMRGERLIRSSYLEDKLIGDLLSLSAINLNDDEYHTMTRRRTFSDASPVNIFDNIFLPSRHSPAVMVHLDTEKQMDDVRRHSAGDQLVPKRLWPTHSRPSLAWSSNQLELLSPERRLRELRDAEFVVVAVARNESLLLPHFLAHYRLLGASHFVIIDNLSNDGTRELALDQPDVTVYSCDTDYKRSHFGVTWQETVLAAHRLGRWSLMADLDEFLIYRDSDNMSLPQLASRFREQDVDAARVYMIDMYPRGDLSDADFETCTPFIAASCHDREPLIRWRLGAGSYSNAPTFLSALRHRLIPNSAPNMFTSQKVSLVRYRPWMRFSEGLHYATGIRIADTPLAFAHFKYHRGFRAKVLEEVARKQHFDDASEYRRYMNMLSEARSVFFDKDLSQEYAGADALCDMLQALQSAS